MNTSECAGGWGGVHCAHWYAEEPCCFCKAQKEKKQQKSSENISDGPVVPES